MSKKFSKKNENENVDVEADNVNNEVLDNAEMDSINEETICSKKEEQLETVNKDLDNDVHENNETQTDEKESETFENAKEEKEKTKMWGMMKVQNKIMKKKLKIWMM